MFKDHVCIELEFGQQCLTNPFVAYIGVNVCGFFDWFDEQRMCDRSKYVILDMKTKLTKLEDDLRICNAEINRLEEDLRTSRMMKLNVVPAGHQPLSLTVCVVLIVDVFVVVLLGNVIVKWNL